MGFHGRRFIKLENGEIRMSGQWVGHRYGSDTGTSRQRRLLEKNCGGLEIIDISDTIVWSLSGYSGDRISECEWEKISKAKREKLTKEGFNPFKEE